MDQTMQSHPMRRKERQLSLEDTKSILQSAEYGTLSMNGTEGAPYAVPLSFVCDGEAVYFHCAMQGHKIDCLRADPRVCFTAVGAVKAVYEKHFTTNYESAMLGGIAQEVEDDAEKRRVLRLLCEKYLPDYEEKIDLAIDHSIGRTAVWKIAPQWMTGKAHRG
jgi:nitroimidazol reductase NimA-like FMN-containing flavoprotein (pyridoxamine 5'-phosphate oxidase superfamily)